MKSKSANPKNLEALLSEKQNEILALKKEIELLQQQTTFKNSPKQNIVSQFNHLLFDNSDDLMFLIKLGKNNKFEFLGVNLSFLKITGLAKEDIIGKETDSIISFKFENQVPTNFERAIETKKQIIYNEKYDFDGNLYFFETTLTPILNDSNEVILLHGVSKDIKENQKAKIAQKQSEDKYKKLFEQANDAIIIFEPETEKVLEVNGTACRIYGFSYDEFISLSLKDITKDIKAGEFHINETFKNNNYVNFETIQYDKNGKELLLLVNASVIEYNGFKAILSVNRNITELRKAEEEAKEAQRQILNIANNFPNASIYQFITDLNNNIIKVTFISEGSNELLGYSPEELINDPSIAYSVIHPLDLAGFLEELAISRLNNKDFEYTYRLKVNGQIKWAYTRITLTKVDEKNKQFDGITIDVTSNKITEISFIENQRFLNTLINNLPGFAYRINSKLNDSLSFISDGIFKLTGYEASVFKADQNFFAELIHPDDKTELLNAHKIAELNKSSYDNEYRIITKDKRVKWIWDRGECVLNQNGEIIAFEGFVTDITESKVSEQIILEKSKELDRQKTFYNNIIENLPVAVFVKDAKNDLKFTLWNKKAEEIYGFTKKELIGKNAFDIWEKEKADKYYQEDLEVSKKNRILELPDNYVELKSGETIFLNSKKVPLIENNSGDVDYILCVSEDVTLKKRQEEAIKETLSLNQATLNSTADGILAIDLEGNVTLYNERFLEIWNINQDDISKLENGKLNRDFIISKVKYVDEYNQNSSAFKENISEPTLYRFELKDGKIIERFSIPQKIDNKIVGRVGSFRDITEQIHVVNELISSKEALEETNKLARVGGWSLDLDNNVLSWSSLTKEIHEVPEDYIPNLETAINFYKEGIDREKITEAVANGVLNGNSWDLELQIITANGAEKWVRAKGTPEFVEGKCVRLYGTFQDIHERKLLDIALQESEEHHRILFEKSPLIKITLDSKGNILAINEKGITELGYSNNELVNKSILSIIDKSDVDIFENYLAESIINIGNTLNFSIKSITSSNNVVLLSIFATSLKNSNSEIIVSLVCENITKEKEIEFALLTSEANLRTVFETTDIGYILFDLNANILTFNTPAYYFNVKKHKKELTVGKNFLDYINQDRVEIVKNVIKEVLLGNKVEYESSDANEFGDVTWYEVVYSPVQSKENEIVGMIMSMKDITQAKLIQNELNNTLKKVETTNNKLQEIIQQKDKFFSIIAHDLRSPFSGFIGLTEMITSEFHELTNEELLSLTVELNKSANNLFKLLENLLEWSRIQRGLVKFKIEEFSLFDKVQKNIDLLVSKADLKSITINNFIPEKTIIKADSQMLDVVIRNILSNALKFTHTGGNVSVSSKQYNDFVEVKISDSGIGIPEDIIKELFEIDSKSSRIGTSGEPSTGLGLLLCKEYIEKHGGKIWAENNPDKGSSFYFTIYNSPKSI